MTVDVAEFSFVGGEARPQNCLNGFGDRYTC